MKFVVLAAAALMMPAAVSAQTTAPATPAAPAVAPATTATARFTLDTPIDTIVADAKGKAVIDADLPGTTSHPMYEQFKGMSLNQLAPMAGDKLTPAVLAKVQADLTAVK